MKSFTFLIASATAFAAAILFVHTVHAGMPPDYYVAYTSVLGPDGHTQKVDRISNVFYSKLPPLEIYSRIRVILHGYTGMLGANGSPKREEAANRYNAQSMGAPEVIKVPDPLE